MNRAALVTITILTGASELVGQNYYSLRAAFLDRKGRVESMQLRLAEETTLTKTYDFLLRSTQRDSLGGRIRIPKGEGPFRTAVLCVGLETGKEVIEMIEGQEDVVMMAFDYPFEGEVDFRGWAAVGTSFRFRSMAFRTVPLILTALDWTFDQPFVDRTDVTVVAVSFGSFTGIPAAVIDQRVKQLVVVQGGGGLSTVIASNARRLGMPIPAWLAGWLGGAIMAPFEPNKYVPFLSPRFLLMVNGEGDTMFPPESASALYDAAREPKELVWHHSDHVMPGEKELIRELTNIVVKRLYER